MNPLRRQRGARRILVVLLVAVCPPSVAFAAGSSPTTTKLGAGFSAVSSCGSLSGVATSWTVTAGKVTAVTVSSIPAACNGAAASLTLVDSSSASIGSKGAVTVAGGSAVFSSISPTPLSTAVAGIHIVLVGP